MGYIERVQVLTLLNDLVNDCTDKDEFYNRIFDAVDAMTAADVMTRTEHECALKECENGYAATLHLERSRIANQREEINRLLEHARKVEKSRIYWKDKAMRLGKQLHETLYGRNEE